MTITRYLCLATCLVASTLAGCALQTTTESEQATSTRRSIATADVNTARSMVQTLASDAFGGRAPGEPGIDLARDYLVEQFDRPGLEPAFGDSFAQPFQVAMGAKVSSKALQFNDHRVDGDAFTVLAFGGSAAFEGKAVFVGYGIASKEHDYDSFAGLDEEALAGAVAVIYRYEPMTDGATSRWSDGGWTPNAHLIRKVNQVAERGAAAALIVNPPSHADAKLHQAASTFGGRAGVPAMMAPQSAFERLLAEADVANPRQAARRWQQQADAGEPHARRLDVTITGEVKLDANVAIAHNVAAIAPGAGTLKDEFIIVGAHYDHVGHGRFGSRTGEDAIHPGADDNASGTAAVLMLAQRHARRIASGEAPANRRSVLFIGFSAEERGLIGSRYFVNHLDQAELNEGQMVAMLNFDMVGRLRDDQLWVAGVDSGEGWRDLVKAAAEPEGLSVKMGGGGLGPSDHTNFYRAGVPVVHLFTGLHTEYHTPADTAEKINAAGIVRVANAAERMIEALYVDEQLALAHVSPGDGGAGSRWMRSAVRGSEDDEQDRGERAYLGVMPVYQAEMPTVDSVVEGTPADKAGLEAGDRLTHWDGEPVADLRQLAGRLARADPGDTVVLTIERDEETLELPVTLGRR